jgi:hypothetical protein
MRDKYRIEVASAVAFDLFPCSRKNASSDAPNRYVSQDLFLNNEPKGRERVEKNLQL